MNKYRRVVIEPQKNSYKNSHKMTCQVPSGLIREKRETIIKSYHHSLTRHFMKDFFIVFMWLYHSSI
jgi:hypothetical protein